MGRLVIVFNMAPTQRYEALLTVIGDTECPILQAAPRRRVCDLKVSVNGRWCEVRNCHTHLRTMFLRSQRPASWTQVSGNDGEWSNGCHL